jgi:hypothetical protein
MEKSLLKEKVRNALLEQSDRYSVIVANNIKDMVIGKSEDEIISLIFDYVFNDQLVGKKDLSTTRAVVYGDEDFISDVLYALKN